MQTKKGFILIYTILLGMICLTIMMYIFDVQLSEVKYSSSNKVYVIKEDKYQKDREYLMTLFFKYIDVNKSQIDVKKINIAFPEDVSNIVEYGGSKVSYDNSENKFDFETPSDALSNRHDYFVLEYIDEKLHLIFIKTEYLKK